MKNYTGLKSNNLTAVEFKKRENNKTYWLFTCDCGNDKIIDASKVFVKNGGTKSCGCLKKLAWSFVVNENQNPTKKKNKKNFIPKIETAQKDIFRKYKTSAYKRNYVFDISFSDFVKIISKNCFYCGSYPQREHKLKSLKDMDVKFMFNGIDRSNNDIGYILDNCVPCCTICNRAKNN